MKRNLCALVVVTLILSMVTPYAFAFDSNLWPAGGQTVMYYETPTAAVPGVFDKSGTWTNKGSFTYLDGSGTTTTGSNYVQTASSGAYVKFYLGTFTPGDYIPWMLPPYTVGSYTNNTADYEIGSTNGSIYASGTNSLRAQNDWLTITNSLSTIHFSGDGTEYIKLAVNGTNSLRVGAIKLAKPTQNDYIVNVSDSTFSKTGSWAAGSQYSCNGLSYATGWKISGTSGAYATYDFKGMIPSGNYDVYFYNTDDNLANCTTAKFHVYSGTGTATDFSFTGWQGRAWMKVNDTPIAFNNVSNEAYVKIQSGSTGGYTRIGAIKLVNVDSAQPAEMLAAPSYGSGAFSITTNGTSISKDTNAVMLVAEYSGTSMSFVTSKPIIIAKGAASKQEQIPLSVKAGCTYKLLVLDSMANIKPLIVFYPYSL